jgi:hypothetical protein
MGELLLGCSSWIYGDTSEKGVWVEYSIPIRTLKRLGYYSQFFNTYAEMLYYLLNMQRGTDDKNPVLQEQRR